MRRIARLLSFAVLGFVALSLAAIVWLKATGVAAKDLPELMDGDIVFQTSTSRQSLPILLASRSSYSHMGLVDVTADGETLVVEAVGPVRTTPLDQWIERGLGGRIAVMRLKEMAEAEPGLVVKAAYAHLDKPYDIYFLDGSDQLYCSELVALAYRSIGVVLGKIQKLRELDVDYWVVRRLIEKRWRQHPVCAQRGATTFDACLEIILDGRLITPQSIAMDSQLELIFSNYPPGL